MSCEAGFTDNRRSEQTTDNFCAQAGATHKTAFREFEIGYELCARRARGRDRQCNIGSRISLQRSDRRPIKNRRSPR